jgi:hypothetical protein
MFFYTDGLVEMRAQPGAPIVHVRAIARLEALDDGHTHCDDLRGLVADGRAE